MTTIDELNNPVLRARHLGDGAYVRRSADPTAIILCTANGVAVRNEVSLEREAFRALQDWAREVMKWDDTRY